MFEGFLDFFDVDMRVKEEGKSEYDTFLALLGGKQFGNGLFNSLTTENIEKWTRVVNEGYPEFAGQYRLFGYDWLGRMFGVDLREPGEEGVLMFEIGTDEVLEIPCDFSDFLNEEIPLYNDACLASMAYKKWLKKMKKPVQYGRCVGYKIPLFLGGKDTFKNMEDSDLEVYWHIICEVKRNIK